MEEKPATAAAKFAEPKSRMTGSPYSSVVIGASAGGLKALGEWVSVLPERFPLRVIIVQHLFPQSQSGISQYLDRLCKLPVKEALEKEKIFPGVVYTAPANYHLLIERDETFSLSVDEKINYSRPSIDVLFESAARVWQSRLIGIILTGANHDGAYGLGVIKNHGGFTMAQDPATAEYAAMPQAAVDAGVADIILPIEKLAATVVTMGNCMK